MKLKHAILQVMGRDTLKEEVNALEIEDVVAGKIFLQTRALLSFRRRWMTISTYTDLYATG